MIEYKSTEGGRHLYNTDIKNLQELALSMVQLFKDCETNFVISGCKPFGRANNMQVHEGYVYIDGRICKVAEAYGLSRDNLYIVAKQEDGESIPYADGTFHYQNTKYYAEAVNTTSPDGSYIKYDVAKGRFPGLGSVFFNKYAVAKNAGPQTIDDLIVNELTTKSNVSTNKGVIFNSNDFYISGDDKGLKIGCRTNGYYFILTSDGKICAYNDDDDVLFTLGGTDGVEINGNNIANIKNDIQNDLVPVGTILMWPNADKLPANYLLCDGRAVTSSEYPELFKVLRDSTSISNPIRLGVYPSTVWTFNVPNLKGRFVVGYDGSDNGDYDTLGKKGGEEAHILNVAEMPSHSHSYDKTEAIGGGVYDGDREFGDPISVRVAAAPSNNAAASGPSSLGPQTNYDVTYSTKETATKGGGQAHENRPPYYVLAYIIKAK